MSLQIHDYNEFINEARSNFSKFYEMVDKNIQFENKKQHKKENL